MMGLKLFLYSFGPQSLQVCTMVRFRLTLLSCSSYVCDHSFTSCSVTGFLIFKCCIEKSVHQCWLAYPCLTYTDDVEAESQCNWFADQLVWKTVKSSWSPSSRFHFSSFAAIVFSSFAATVTSGCVQELCVLSKYCSPHAAFSMATSRSYWSEVI